MATTHKTLIKEGIYHAPQGTLRVDRRRLQGWVDRFRAMKRAGLKIPCCWGHQPEAEPGNENDRAVKQFWLSRFNAGYLDDLRLTPDGKLDGKLDCPGVNLDSKGNLTAWVKLPDGRQVRTAIGEVSLAIKDWTDGSGRKWDDSIIHLGITPLPVVHGTGGFKPAGAWNLSSVCDDAGNVITLSLLNWHTELGTESEADMAEDKDTDKGGDKGKGEGGGGGKDYFKKGLDILAKMGLSLPDDTDEGNFWERVCVAGHALDAAGAGGAAAAVDMDADLDMDAGADTDLDMDAGADDLMDDMGAGADAGAADEGVEYSGEDAETGNEDEEPRPVMMSLTSVKNPRLRAGIQKRQDEHRAKLLSRINRLTSKAITPQVRAELSRLREAVDSYTLSLTEDWEIVPKRLDERVRDFELSLATAQPLKKTRVAPRPDIRRGREEKQETPEEIKRRAAEVSSVS